MSMNQADIQLLRHAALEIQADKQNLVRVAGIIQRIKNWWKARWNPEFREKSEQVQEAYSGMKQPLTQLINQLKQFENAVQSQSADEAARIVTEVQSTLSSVVNDMRNLKSKLKAVDVIVPSTYVDENGKELSGNNLGNVTRGYSKNRELIENLWEQLPVQFREEIPIGKRINQPITNFSWFKNYSPSDIVFTNDVRSMTKRLLFQKLSQYFDESTLKTIEQGYDVFLDNLKTAILTSSILIQVNFPNVSETVKNRRSNEMQVEVGGMDVPYPISANNEIYISVGKLLFHDLGASINPVKRISVFLARHLDLSTHSQAQLREAQLRLQVQEAEKEEARKAKGREYAAKSRSTKKELKEQQKEDLKEPKKASDGPITRIVKKAILRESLPLTNAIVKVYGQTFHHKVRFAKVLSSALRQEIDAECSVRQENDDVQVQVSICGSKFASLTAIHGISMYVADRFIESTKVGVNVDVIQGISSFGLMESEVLDTSLRKVAFDCWR